MNVRPSAGTDVKLRVTTETDKVTMFSKWMLDHQLVRMWNCEWLQKQWKLQCLVNYCQTISWSGCEIASDNI